MKDELRTVIGLTVKDLKEFGISEDLADNKALQSIIDDLEMYVPADNVESREKERMLLDSPIIAKNGHLNKKRLKANIDVVKNRVSGAWVALETVGNKLASKYKDNELEDEIEAIREQLTEVNASLYKISCGWDELMTWERYGRFMGRKIRENQKSKGE